MAMEEGNRATDECAASVPALSGPGLFKDGRHVTDTVADYYLNEGVGTPEQVYEWFQSLAQAADKPLNVSLQDVRSACRLLSTEFSLREAPLLIQARPGCYALQNAEAW
jgi:hypothetical protein